MIKFCQESFGTIGDSATAMRDPIFYRWHAFIDDIFQEFKATLPGYTGPQVRNIIHHMFLNFYKNYKHSVNYNNY